MDIKKAWNALLPKFVGGEVLHTHGSVKGDPAMGVTADLLKSSGEIRVHRVRANGGEALVTLELCQHEVPGDGNQLTCVRLPVSEAARLGDLLREAVSAAEQGAT